MTQSWIASPPVTLVLFVLLIGGLYWLSGRWAARSVERPGKHAPYACGEDLLPGEVKLSYQRFFRLALMFVMVHMATLVLATLPSGKDMRLLAMLYMGGVAIALNVLVRKDPQ